MLIRDVGSQPPAASATPPISVFGSKNIVWFRRVTIFVRLPWRGECGEWPISQEIELFLPFLREKIYSLPYLCRCLFFAQNYNRWPSVIGWYQTSFLRSWYPAFFCYLLSDPPNRQFSRSLVQIKWQYRTFSSAHSSIRIGYSFETDHRSHWRNESMIHWKKILQIVIRHGYYVKRRKFPLKSVNSKLDQSFNFIITGGVDGLPS